jgi:hypothetical protein
MRLLFALILAATVHGQWLDYPSPGVPRTKNGKVNLSAKMPKTRDGRPDLSGVWHVQTESLAEKRKLFGAEFGDEQTSVPGMEDFTISKYAHDITLDYKPSEIVMTPAAEDARKARRAIPPGNRNPCLPYGMPRTVVLSEAHKIVQTPGLILIILELDSMTRQIYVDGRPLPVDPSPSWQGYSVGHWDKDALVVETIGFNGKTFLDGVFHPTSEHMKMTERYARRDVGHLDVEMTFDDAPCTTSLSASSSRIYCNRIATFWSTPALKMSAMSPISGPPHSNQPPGGSSFGHPSAVPHQRDNYR